MGLIVNLVGMWAFGHHHAHGHGHGHDHSHNHNHNHNNENMRGIYLHILADTLGSVSVIVSTALTHFTRWSFWDPLASCFIASLIFLSSCPLVMHCSRRLILSIPYDAEYSLRNTLAGIMDQKGVVGYAAPKFWMDDRSSAAVAKKQHDNCEDDHDDNQHNHHNHHDHHDHAHGDHAEPGKACLYGVVHVLASRLSNSEHVRESVSKFLLQEGIEAVVQVEKEGDGGCWCGIGRTPVMPSPLMRAF
jgi:zinc transporter 5/7